MLRKLRSGFSTKYHLVKQDWKSITFLKNGGKRKARRKIEFVVFVLVLPSFIVSVLLLECYLMTLWHNTWSISHRSWLWFREAKPRKRASGRQPLSSQLCPRCHSTIDFCSYCSTATLLSIFHYFSILAPNLLPMKLVSVEAVPCSWLSACFIPCNAAGKSEVFGCLWVENHRKSGKAFFCSTEVWSYLRHGD